MIKLPRMRKVNVPLRGNSALSTRNYYTVRTNGAYFLWFGWFQASDFLEASVECNTAVLEVFLKFLARYQKWNVVS